MKNNRLKSDKTNWSVNSLQRIILWQYVNVWLLLVIPLWGLPLLLVMLAYVVGMHSDSTMALRNEIELNN